MLSSEKFIYIGVAILLLGGLAVGWKYTGISVPSQAQPSPSVSTSSKLPHEGKKVLYIDSYHEGYDWSDGITRGIMKTFEGTGVELRVFRMDTKRNTTEEFKKAVSVKAKAEIDAFRPDVLIVSDDNAFKYIVVEYYKNAALPVVFSGLNWDAGLYGAPFANTTGMVEVSLTPEIIVKLKEYAKGTRVGFLSASNETEQKNLDYYQKLFNIKFSKSYLVTTMAEWKTAFTKLQTESDVLIFENNAGIADWSDEEAEAHALKYTKIPVGTTNPWTMRESLLGITKVPDEQGEWSANAALQILSGVPAASIPLVKNKQGKLYVNFKIADVLGIKFPPSLLKNAEVIK